MITMEDILEEYDEIVEKFKKIDNNTYNLSGKMTISDTNKLLNEKIIEGYYDTISGYLQELLGRIQEE